MGDRRFGGCYITRFLGNRLLPEQRIDERRGLRTGARSSGPSPRPTSLTGNTQFLPARGRRSHPLPCRRVLVNATPGDVDDFGKHPGLRQPVLPDRGIEHQQHLVDLRAPADHPLDLAEFVHSGRSWCGSRPAVVDHHHVRPPDSMPLSTASNATDAGVGALGPAHHLRTHPGGPGLQLVGRGGAEGGRRRRATTRRPSATRTRASFSDGRRSCRVPLTPTTSSTDGLLSCGSALDRAVEVRPQFPR